MKNEDIESYLQMPISLIIPYFNKKIKQINDSPMYKFTKSQILGLNSHQEKKKNTFSLKKIMSR